MRSVILESAATVMLGPATLSFWTARLRCVDGRCRAALVVEEAQLMDDQTRIDLLARLSDAQTREKHAREQVQAHARGIDEVRKTLGNPYFYSGRPPDDPESEAHFTGYQSHEPAFQLMRAWQDAARDVKTIQRQLREAGFTSD
jgi:hypothetical protein